MKKTNSTPPDFQFTSTIGVQFRWNVGEPYISIYFTDEKNETSDGWKKTDHVIHPPIVNTQKEFERECRHWLSETFG